jgi:hypothetical protein
VKWNWPAQVGVFTGIAVLALTTATTQAQVDQKTVQRWFDAEWDRSHKEFELDKAVIHYRVEYRDTVDAAQIDEWKRKAKGKPDNPLHQKITKYERRLLNGPDIKKCTIWFQGAGKWRCNETSLYDPAVGMYDSAVSGDVAWGMTDGQLRIFDKDKPEDGFDVPRHEGAILADLGKLLYGGVGFGPGFEPDRKPLMLSGSEWSVRISPGPRWYYELRGHWDHGAGRGFVDEWELLSWHENPDQVGIRCTYAKWKEDPVLNCWVCGEVVEYDQEGRIKQALVFESAEPFDPANFKSIAAVPSVRRPDPVRGDLEIRSIYDHRAGKRTESSKSKDGFDTRSMTPSVATHTGSWIRRLGWLVLAGLVVLFVVLRVRRGLG